MGPTPFTQCIILELKVGAELNTYYEDDSFACFCILNFGKTKTQYRFNGINDDEESEKIIDLKSGDICIGPFKKMKWQCFPNNAQIVRVLFIINKTSAELFLRNNGFDERIRKFKETNHFHLISTTLHPMHRLGERVMKMTKFMEQEAITKKEIQQNLKK